MRLAVPLRSRALVVYFAIVACVPPPSVRPDFGPAGAKAGKAGAASPAEFDEVEYRLSFDAGGRVTRAIRERYRILVNDPPQGFGEVSATYVKDREELPELRATVWTADGQVATLDPRTIADAPADDGAATYSDRRRRVAAIPRLSRGSVVEREFVVAERVPLLEGAGRLALFPLDWWIPVRRFRVVVEAPAGAPLQVELRGSALVPERSESGGRVRLVYETMVDGQGEDPEPGSPPESNPWPHGFVSTGTSWNAVARAYGRLVDRSPLPAPIAAEVASLTSSAATVDGKVNRLLRENALRLRYVGLELGDGSLRPRTPEETLGRGYGDCKDLSLLLVQQLRSLGIAAELALVETGDGMPLPSALPGFGRFDHAIVRLPDGRFIDPTVRFSGAGELPSALQGRPALVVSDATTAIESIPSLHPSANRWDVTYRVELPEFGRGRAVLTTEATGPDWSALRPAAFDDEARYKEAVAGLARRSAGAEGDVSVTHSDASAVGTPFREELTFTSATANAEERNALVEVPWAVLVDGVPFMPPDREGGGKDPWATRKTPFEWYAPHRKSLVVTVAYPVFYEPVPVQPVDVPIGDGRFTVTADGSVPGLYTLRATLDTGPRRVPADRFLAAREAFLAAWRGLPGQLEFRSRVLDALERDGLGAVWAAARQLYETAPVTPMLRVIRARVLASYRLSDAAREELDAVIAAEPGFVPARRYAAFLAKTGRWSGLSKEGADLAAAEAHARAVLERTPGDLETRKMLARLLLRGTDGETFGPGARLEDGVAVLAAVEPGDLDAETARLHAGGLLLLGRHAEVLSTFPRWPRDAKVDGLLFLSALRSLGIGPGAEKARQLLGEDVRVLPASNLALLQLMQAGDFTLAAQATLALSGRFGRPRLDPAQRRNMENVIASVAGRADPRQRLLDRLVAWAGGLDGVDPPPWSPAPAPDLTGKVVSLFREGMDSASKATGLELAGAGRNVALFGFAAFEWKQDGTDPLGTIYAARIPGSQRVFRVLVTGTQDAPTIHGAAVDATLLADDELRALDADDIERAVKLEELRRQLVLFGTIGNRKGPPPTDPAELRCRALEVKVSDGLPDAAARAALAAFGRSAPTTRLRRRVLERLADAATDAGSWTELLAVADEVRGSPFARDLPHERWRARALARLGRHEEALAARKGPDPARAGLDELMVYADLLSAVGRAAEALPLVAAAARRFPDDPSSVNNHVWFSLLVPGADVAGPLATLEAALSDRSHRDAGRLDTLAVALAHVGRTEEALEVLHELAGKEKVAFEEGPVGRWYVLARAAEEAKRFDVARTLYERLVAEPKRPRSELAGLARDRLAVLPK